MAVKIIEQRMQCPSRIWWLLKIRGALVSRPKLLESPTYPTPSNVPTGFESKYSVSLTKLDLGNDSLALDNLDFWAPCVVRPTGTAPIRRTIVYYCGGGFTAIPIEPHWALAASLAQRLQAEVIVQMYQMAPHADVHDNIDNLVTLYQHTTKIPRQQNREILMGGDSAGGAITATMLLALHDRSIPLPHQAFLISPVLDCDLDKPETRALESEDAMLSVNMLNDGFTNWALRPSKTKNGTDTEAVKAALLHPYASPIHGDWSFAGSGDVKIIVLAGGWDLLFAQSEAFVQKCQAVNNIDLTYIRADKASHDWPLFGALPLASFLAPDSQVGLDHLITTIEANSASN